MLKIKNLVLFLIYSASILGLLHCCTYFYWFCFTNFLNPSFSTVHLKEAHGLLVVCTSHFGNLYPIWLVNNKNTRKVLNRFSTKTAKLGTLHIIRKVLQTWSLSGGVHCWFKRRSTRKKKKTVIGINNKSIQDTILTYLSSTV